MEMILGILDKEVTNQFGEQYCLKNIFECQWKNMGSMLKLKHYPTKVEIFMLAHKTRLSTCQVKNWFAKRRIK